MYSLNVQPTYLFMLICLFEQIVLCSLFSLKKKEKIVVNNECECK